jgi:hypothetical protein
LASKARPRGPWKGASSAATGYDAAVVAATFADGLGDAGTAAVAEGAAEPIVVAAGDEGAELEGGFDAVPDGAEPPTGAAQAARITTSADHAALCMTVLLRRVIG